MIGMFVGMASNSSHGGSSGIGITTATERVSAASSAWCWLAGLGTSGIGAPLSVRGGVRFGGSDAHADRGEQVREVVLEVLGQGFAPGPHGVHALQVEGHVPHDL